MTWILLVIIIGTGNASTTLTPVEFIGKQNCEEAATQLNGQSPIRRSGKFRINAEIRAFCVEKGDSK